MSLRLGVLASGRGSNFEALHEHCAAGTLDASIALLISDRPKAKALERAEALGIPCQHIAYDKADRSAFEQQAAEAFRAADCDLIVLAGFMRILTPGFIAQFEGRILNIHPSLLPAFKGLHPQRQALEAGVKFSGCTVHRVTPDLDDGPILAQAVVPVNPEDTEETLSARILEQEHRIYAEALQQLAGKYSS